MCVCCAVAILVVLVLFANIAIQSLVSLSPVVLLMLLILYSCVLPRKAEKKGFLLELTVFHTLCLHLIRHTAAFTGTVLCPFWVIG